MVLAYAAVCVAVILLSFERGPAVVGLVVVLLGRGWLIVLAHWACAHDNRFARVIVGAWVATTVAVLVVCVAVTIRGLSR